MAAGRIYLGVDIHSNLAVSLETVGSGVYYLTVSTGDRKSDLCRFLCSEEALEGITQNRPFGVHGTAGNCSIEPDGDEVIVEFQRAGDPEPSKCTLSATSFARVLQLARNRAFVG